MLRLLLTLLVFLWACPAVTAPPAPPMNPLVPGQSPAPPRAPPTASKIVPRPQTTRAPQSSADRAAIAQAARLNLKSASLVVLDQPRARVLMAREPDKVMPIASITKLMTAMVVLDARLRMDEVLTIGNDDVDRVKMSGSRLRVGTRLTRREMLHLALMSSENRAASALSRHYPGGRPAFIKAMNAKARALGMSHSHFVDSTGLSKLNVSTAMDLVRMVGAAYRYQSIRQFTTIDRHVIKVNTGGKLTYLNSNRLVQTRSREWQIDVSKTGYTSEAGRCLVMHARIKSRPVIVVLLNSWGKLTPIGDANRIRRWVELHG